MQRTTKLYAELLWHTTISEEIQKYNAQPYYYHKFMGRSASEGAAHFEGPEKLLVSVSI